MNRDGLIIVAIVVGSLLLNLAQFIIVMCLWQGC